VLQCAECVAVISATQIERKRECIRFLLFVSLKLSPCVSSVLQRVAACCSVLQRVAVCVTVISAARIVSPIHMCDMTHASLVLRDVGVVTSYLADENIHSYD